MLFLIYHDKHNGNYLKKKISALIEAVHLDNKKKCR